MRRVWLVALLGCGRLDFAPASDGSVDASRDAADGDAAASCAGYEICDGFEGASFATVWQLDLGATLDATVAHRGSQSVHFQSTALATSQQGYFRLYESKTLPLADATFYVRAWLRFGGLPASTNGMELIAAYQTSGGSEGDYLFLHSTGLDIYDEFTAVDMATATAPPLDTWLCMLWTVHRDPTAGSITLAGDPEMLVIDGKTDTSPPIAVIAFGIGFSAPNVDVAQPPLDVWMDDVIVDKSPLTCAD